MVLNILQASSQESYCWSIICKKKIYGQSIIVPVFDKWHGNRVWKKCCLCTRVYAITWLKKVILLS